MIRIGIDPSINSTGICIWDTKTNKTHYYLIPSKMTKVMKDFESNKITIIPYTKLDPKGLDYSSKENIKFDNIYNISLIIKDILKKYKDNEIDIYMEGVSYGSVGSAALVDLSFLNASIRMILKELEINFNIISPTQVKKFACANGQAEKDIIIDAWKRLDRDIINIKGIKIDDLADSYFLSHYQEIK
jgi:Holliday junction resolvasome RuvABC endonuclease subunit